MPAAASEQRLPVNLIEQFTIRTTSTMSRVETYKASYRAATSAAAADIATESDLDRDDID